MKTLKVVSIGGFGHSVFVFDDMLGMKEAELIGLAPAFPGEDISFFTSHELCGEVPVYDDYPGMLEKLNPDVAVISTRLDIIPEVIMAAADAGCHIIAEKPLALDMDTLERVRESVDRNGVKLTAMLSMRSEPQFIAAKDLYDSGVIGEAVLVNGRKSYKWGSRAEWMGDKAKYGGTIPWVGIHAVDFTNFITGLGFTKVAAMKGNFSHPERPACEDNCTMILELSNGGHATVSVDLHRPGSGGTWGDDWIRVVGTKGIIEARGSDLTCTVLVDSELPVPVELPGKSKMFRDFLLAVAGDDSIPIPQEESFMLTKVCLCGQESAEQGSFFEIL
ncbi:MAG: Gfo/Idh/MocA family protein [Puniceicoccaceae bacterium]